MHRPSRKAARLIAVLVLLFPTLVQPQAQAGYASDPNLEGVRARYLGVAGWEITDGKTHILIDPYLSRLPGPPAGGGTAGPGWPGKMSQDDLALPDTAAIDLHVDRADYIVLTHAHYVHMLDVPYIARTRKAIIIGNESVANIARDYGVPDEQIVTIRGEKTSTSEHFRCAFFQVCTLSRLESIISIQATLQRGRSGRYVSRTSWRAASSDF